MWLEFYIIFRIIERFDSKGSLESFLTSCKRGDFYPTISMMIGGNSITSECGWHDEIDRFEDNFYFRRR